ncbi:hypothetical protein NDU88_007464 [Pleurodeles waltl]|uniref:Uncharacterized protein n=1 Tax=Pleurodeles waltl TaxID=8319 RepID=A0AAV7RT05_PLEWA|nr:hypothetical protein NDU88_007464 [Pleurodeles waltl]
MAWRLEVLKARFKYLGFEITMAKDRFLRENFDRALEELEVDVKRWGMPPLAIMGRASLYNMITLPKLLFVLQNNLFEMAEAHLIKNDTILRLLPWNEGEITQRPVSHLYHTLINHIPHCLRSLRAGWEDAIGEMEDIDWEEALMHLMGIAI